MVYCKILCIAVMSVSLCQAQTQKESLQRELTFNTPISTSSTLMIFNINGNVSVTGYAGEKVLVSAEKIIKAKTPGGLRRGIEQIQLDVLQLNDTIILSVRNECFGFGRTTERNRWRQRGNNWGYQWNERGHCDLPYDYILNINVHVPAALRLAVSTINDGDINIEHTQGAIVADNINGSISLRDIGGGTRASTINGDVDLEYTSNPGENSRYYTLNGNINATFQSGLSANLAFESYNGELFTNVEQLESLPLMIEIAQDQSGVRYKVAGSRYKIRNGGILLDFETFNGNVYLKEKGVN